MGAKDLAIVVLGVLGWLWAILQFALNRRYQKNDKAVEKRFEVYSNFMNQMDEMNLKMRNDPKLSFGIQTELMSEILSGEEDRINNALLSYNSQLMEITKNSMEPLMIINQELNKLRLIASDNLLPKIIEYKKIVNDFTDEFQTVLSQMSGSTDLEKNANELQKVAGQEVRNNRMKTLWEEIEKLMREEIGYYKN